MPTLFMTDDGLGFWKKSPIWLSKESIPIVCIAGEAVRAQMGNKMSDRFKNYIIEYLKDKSDKTFYLISDSVFPEEDNGSNLVFNLKCETTVKLRRAIIVSSAAYLHESLNDIAAKIEMEQSEITLDKLEAIYNYLLTGYKDKLIFKNEKISKLSRLIHEYNNRFAALRIDYQTLSELDNINNAGVSEQIYRSMFNENCGYLIKQRDGKTAVEYLATIENDETEIFDNIICAIKVDDNDGGGKVSEIFKNKVCKINLDQLLEGVRSLVCVIDLIDNKLREAREKEIQNAQ